MQILRSIHETRHASKALRTSGDTLGLVPTMGALHEGHLSLIRAARAACDRVAVSIFVNPTQFAPNEDLDRYPRTFAEDCALLEPIGVDLLFAPTAQEMYPAGTETFVEVPHIGNRLDGASRPHHFRGVATVVTKLFNILQPTHAFFGQKDAAQVAVLRAMVRDLNIDIDLVVCPTIREADGLALSSRNRYLSPCERTLALSLPRALEAASQQIAHGEQNPETILADITHHLQAAGLTLDYAALVNPHTLQPITDLTLGALLAVAAWARNTRLIDNLLLTPVPLPTKTEAVLVHPPPNGRAGLQPCHSTSQEQGALAPEVDCQPTPRHAQAQA